MDRLADGVGKAVAVDGERAAGRNLVLVGAGHDQRSGQPHLGMDDADGVGRRIVRAERVRAYQLGKAVGPVGIRAAHSRASHGE